MDNNIRAFAIQQAQEKYSPTQLVLINSRIRQLACEHYMYGKHMPLVFGKARGICDVLKFFYSIDVSVYYVWDVLEEYCNEPKE